MTSPESMSGSLQSVGSSWGQPTVPLATEGYDTSMVPGTMMPCQTSLRDTDSATGQMTIEYKPLVQAIPGFDNAARFAATSGQP